MVAITPRRRLPRDGLKIMRKKSQGWIEKFPPLHLAYNFLNGWIDNKKSNLGLFAAVFAAIFAATYGIFSIGKNLKNRGAAMEQAIGEAEKLFQKGMTDDEIFNVFCADAARQTKRSVNDGEIRDKVKSVVLEAKKRFEAGGAAVSTSGSLSSPSDLDGSIETIMLALQNALQKSQPILKFDDLYAKAKEAEQRTT